MDDKDVTHKGNHGNSSHNSGNVVHHLDYNRGNTNTHPATRLPERLATTGIRNKQHAHRLALH